MRIEGDEPREPEDVVICTPATTPSRARVALDDCTLAMSADFTTVAEPVKASFVVLPKAITMVSSSASASGASVTLILVFPATATSDGSYPTEEKIRTASFDLTLIE